jgi:hypothetical protein
MWVRCEIRAVKVNREVLLDGVYCPEFNAFIYTDLRWRPTPECSSSHEMTLEAKELRATMRNCQLEDVKTVCQRRTCGEDTIE